MLRMMVGALWNPVQAFVVYKTEYGLFPPIAYQSDTIKICFACTRQASRGLRRTSMISQTSEQRALLTFCAAFAKCPKDGERLGEIMLFEDQPQAASACACNQHSIRDADFFQTHRVQSAFDARCRLFSKASRVISIRCAMRAFFKSIALHANQSLTSSFTEAASPAMPWISDGMMILVACPSAAFWKASRLLSLMTASSSCASLMSLRPSAVA